MGTLRSKIASAGPNGTWLYFIISCAEGSFEPTALKIGISNDPAGRLETLQCGSSSKLWLAAGINFADRNQARTMERTLHQIFSKHRMAGEWFQANGQTIGIMPYLDQVGFLHRFIEGDANGSLKYRG